MDLDMEVELVMEGGTDVEILAIASAGTEIHSPQQIAVGVARIQCRAWLASSAVDIVSKIFGSARYPFPLTEY